MSSDDWARMLESAGELTPYREVEALDTVHADLHLGHQRMTRRRCKVSHFMVLMSGANLVQKFDVTADDTCYLSMPLFHSNALVAGWGVAVGDRCGNGAGEVLGFGVP